MHRGYSFRVEIQDLCARSNLALFRLHLSAIYQPPESSA